MQFIGGTRQLSPREFGLLGIEHLAYVKAVTVEGEGAFAVYAADGSQIAVLEDRELACAVVRQHDMEPVSVH